jgi:DNA-binding transcriptional LysR family regulator
MAVSSENAKAIAVMIEMREIEAFLAVAEELHFGRAGERLGLSTSRVSHLVRTLERRLGVRLLERTSRQVRLSSEGEYLFEEVRPATTRIEQALANVRDFAGSEILRVGFASTLPEHIASELVRAFERRYPGCRVVQSGRPAVEMFLPRPSREWDIDVFVTWMPGELDSPAIEGLRAGPVILRESRVVALAADHPLANRDVIDIEDLADYEVLYFLGLPTGVAERWAPSVTPAGKPMRLRRLPSTYAYVEETMRLVTEDGAAHLTFTSVLSRRSVPGVVLVPVTGLPQMTVIPIWPRGNRDRLIEAFAKLAHAHAISAGWVTS